MRSASGSSLGSGSMYLGDEAVVETRVVFTRGDGRSARSGSRSPAWRSNGYTAELLPARRALATPSWASSEAVSRSWPPRSIRTGVRDVHSTSSGGKTTPTASLVSGAGTRDGYIRGFLHFRPELRTRLPSRSSLMRRRRDNAQRADGVPPRPRGSSCSATRGVEEASLNFAAFARFVHAPARQARNVPSVERYWSPTLSFQIERLHRFNTKFFPRLGAFATSCTSTFSLFPGSAWRRCGVEGQLPQNRVSRRR